MTDECLISFLHVKDLQHFLSGIKILHEGVDHRVDELLLILYLIYGIKCIRTNVPGIIHVVPECMTEKAPVCFKVLFLYRDLIQRSHIHGIERSLIQLYQFRPADTVCKKPHGSVRHPQRMTHLAEHSRLKDVIFVGAVGMDALLAGQEQNVIRYGCRLNGILRYVSLYLKIDYGIWHHYDAPYGYHRDSICFF